MIAVALLALALGANTVQVKPPVVTLGPRAHAEVQVQLEPSGAPAKVEITSNVGEVSRVESLGGGRFRAHFRAPGEHFPSVALVLVEVKRGGTTTHEWTSIPLQAGADLKVETKPKAAVRVDVGALHFGPARANARGRVRVQVVVPPGVPNAIVHSKDLAGNESEKRIPLPVQPYARVRTAMSRDSASWADAQPLELEVFAVDPSGTPLESARGLEVNAREGTLGPARASGHGSFLFSYRAPDVLRAEQDRITFSLRGGSAAGTEVAVPLRAGPAAKVAIALQPARYVAGSGRRIGVQVRVTDAKGNPVVSTERPEISADPGRVHETASGLELEIPDGFEGRTALEVRARVGALTGSSSVALIPAAAVSATLTLDHGYAVAGKPIEGTLVLRDRFGNPTSAEGVTVVGPGGERAQITPGEAGAYRVRYTPGASVPPGPVALDVRRSGTTLGHSSALTVLAAPDGWELTGSLALAGQTNLARARGIFPRVGMGMRVGRTSFEAIAELDLRLYAGFDTRLNGIQEHGTMHGFAAALGARYSRPIGVRWTVHGSAVLGIARTRSTLSGTGPLEATTGSEIKTFPLFRLAGGPAYRVGQGSVFADLSFETASASGHISGNVGGIGIVGGYLYPF